MTLSLKVTELGLEGLHDELRPGRPRTYEDDKVAEVINRALQTKPNRRFNLGEMTERVVHAICSCTERPEHLLRSAEFAT